MAQMVVQQEDTLLVMENITPPSPVQPPLPSSDSAGKAPSIDSHASESELGATLKIDAALRQLPQFHDKTTVWYSPAASAQRVIMNNDDLKAAVCEESALWVRDGGPPKG